MDILLQDQMLRSESGKLVARSQFDFHHIVEQWVQPGGKKNHSTRRKERLIEDGRVIKEAFEYGESENEHVAQNKLNFHHHPLVNISSRHKNKSGKVLDSQSFHESGIMYSRNSAKYESLSSLVKAQEQPDGIKQPQSPLLRNNHNESIVRRSVGPINNHMTHIISKNLNQTKPIEMGDEAEGDSTNNNNNIMVNSRKTQNVEFANIHIQKSDHGGVVDSQAKQPLLASEMKPDVRNQVPTRSDLESDGGVDSGAKDAVVDTQLQHGPQSSKSKMKPVATNLQAQVNARASTELEAMDTQAKSGVHSNKLDVVNHQESTKYKQPSELRRNIHAEVPMMSDDKAKGDAMDNQAKHGPLSELKMNSGVANQVPVNPGHESNNAALDKRGLLPSEWKVKSSVANKMPASQPEGATMDKQLQSLKSKVKPGVTSRNTSKLYKGADSTPSKVHVVSVNSHGRTIKVVRHHDDALIKTRTKQQKMNPAPPLILNASAYSSSSSQSNNPLDQESIDFDLDPRYAHLPPAVKKKLAAIRKDRLKRINFIRLIRKRCGGRKYCLHRVKSNERALHDNCFYEAILAEKDGVELNPCQCNVIYPPTTRVINVHGQAAPMAVSTSHPLVALVSLPGSGNTWVRGLLEQATGYCTGSMWCDPILRAKRFCAEGVRSNTLVVKNHDPNIRWLKEKLAVNSSDYAKPSFTSAIFVHRDPYEATIAEWNRALGYKVYNATKHNLTVVGIGYYNVSAVKDQHTVTFAKEAFGK